MNFYIGMGELGGCGVVLDVVLRGYELEFLGVESAWIR